MEPEKTSREFAIHRAVVCSPRVYSQFCPAAGVIAGRFAVPQRNHAARTSTQQSRE